MWPWYAQYVHRGPYQLHVMTVGPVHRQTHRNALSFGQHGCPAPKNSEIFASVSGVGAGFSPRPGPIWSWGPCSANSSPVPSIRHSVQAHPPQFQEGNPFLKAQVGGGSGANAGGVQRFPLATGAQDVENAVGAGPVRNPGAASGKGGYSPVGEGVGPAPSTVRRIPGRSRWWGWSEWPGRRGVVGAVWILSISSFPKFSRASATFPIHYSCGFHPFLG